MKHFRTCGGAPEAPPAKTAACVKYAANRSTPGRSTSRTASAPNAARVSDMGGLSSAAAATRAL